MKRSFVCQIFLPAMVVIFSCTPRYITEYHTHLLNSEPKSLEFKDSLFVFEFYPVPNGLFYNITNLTNDPVTLEWDRCYFIEPTGNPSRAINIDGVRENSRTNELPTNISIIPPKASFGRFTTSALNVQQFTSLKTKQTSYYYKFINTSVSYSYATLYTIFNYGRYWPNYTGPVFEPADSLHKNDLSLPIISSYVRKNNNMGIGFCMRLKDTIVNYKFDFKIDKISIYKARDTANLELLFDTHDSSDWKWVKAPLSVPVLKEPLKGATIDSLSVNLRWNKPIGAISYSVQVSTDSLFHSFVSVDTGKIWSSKTVSRLNNNCTYYWRVSAKFKDGQSAWTAPSIFTTNFKKKIAR